MRSMNFPKARPFALSIIAAALLSGGVLAQTPPPADETPVVVIEDRAARLKVDDRPGTLDAELQVVDPNTGTVVLTIPAGTEVGREKTEMRFGPAVAPAEPVVIRQRADVRDAGNVTLGSPVTVTNRETGQTLTLDAGTVLRIDRLKLDQRRDAAGNLIRNRVDLRAVLADGTRVRIRERLAPEIEAVEVENEVDEVENEVENEAGDRQRRRGRDATASGGRSGGDRAASDSGRHGRGSSDSPERFSRPDRGGRDSIERTERVERPDRGGSGSDGGGHSGRH